MGIFTPNLIGSEVFPLAPKQEKLYYYVATDGPVNHFDGDVDESFMDDIKRFMKPVLASLKPKNQRKENFLARWENEFEEDWMQKFPYASHRIRERNSQRHWLSMTECSAQSFSFSPNLYEDDQVRYLYLIILKFYF